MHYTPNYGDSVSVTDWGYRNPVCLSNPKLRLQGHGASSCVSVCGPEKEALLCDLYQGAPDPDEGCSAQPAVARQSIWVWKLEVSSVNCRFLSGTSMTWCKFKQPGNCSCLYRFPHPFAGARRDQIQSLIFSCTTPSDRACKAARFGFCLFWEGFKATVSWVLERTVAGNQNVHPTKSRCKVST